MRFNEIVVKFKLNSLLVKEVLFIVVDFRVVNLLKIYFFVFKLLLFLY